MSDDFVDKFVNLINGDKNKISIISDRLVNRGILVCRGILVNRGILVCRGILVIFSKSLHINKAGVNF